MIIICDIFYSLCLHEGDRKFTAEHTEFAELL